MTKQKNKTSRAKLSPIYNNSFTFYKNHDINDFIKRSPESRVDRHKDNY